MLTQVAVVSGLLQSYALKRNVFDCNVWSTTKGIDDQKRAVILFEEM